MTSNQLLGKIMNTRIDRGHPAYQSGREAFARNESYKSNPNATDSNEEFQWGAGWLEAKNADATRQAQQMLKFKIG